MPVRKHLIVRKRYLVIVYTYQAQGESSRFRFQRSDMAKQFGAAQYLRDAVYQVVVWNLYYGGYTKPGVYPGTIFALNKNESTSHV